MDAGGQRRLRQQWLVAAGQDGHARAGAGLAHPPAQADPALAGDVDVADQQVGPDPADELLRVADAAIAINPNYASEYTYRSTAEVALGQYEQAKSDVQQAMRLSPRDPRMAPWHDNMAEAEFGLGHFDAVIEEANKAIDGGFKVFWPYLYLAAAHVLKGDIDEAKTTLTEARRLNPKLSVKYLMAWKRLCPSCAGYTYLQPWFEALHKAGLPEE